MFAIFLSNGLATCGCYYEGGIIHVEPRDSETHRPHPTAGKSDSIMSPAQSTEIDTATVPVLATSGPSETDTHTTTPETGSDTVTDTIPDTNLAGSEWTFFSFADMQDNHTNGINHIRSMVTLDPNAVALFEVGDFNHYGSRAGWESHHTAIAKGIADAGAPPDAIRTDATDWGNFIRLLGAPGNHEFGSWAADWYSLWREFLPGQQQLGVSSEDGAYFAISYDNALFILLDSNHPGTAQTDWLKSILEGPDASTTKWKIALFHEPVYSCSYREPFAPGLDWVTLFEAHNVDLVINGHTHTYEQMCPMTGGKCATGDEHGVVYLTASGGGTGYQRAVDENKSAQPSYGDRTDSYTCTDILDVHESYWHHFCHYTVADCALTVRCYDHDYWDGGEMRHEFVINKCEK